MPSDAEVLLAMPSALRAMADNAERMISETSAARVVELETEVHALEREVQRRDDLVTELRRQMKVLERLATEGRTASEKVRKIERIHVWRNEDGKDFMFGDDVRTALGIGT